jgi:uncharacterized RDD family membrane protein YckC
LKYAGFWIRFAAKIVDTLILSVANGVIMFFFGLFFAAALRLSQGAAAFPAAMLVSSASYVILVLSYNTFFLGKFGATPGKMACKLKVVTPEGRPISYLTGFARYFGELVSAMVCCIGYLMVCWDPERRALHDRICNTRVVYAQTPL